MNVLVEGMEANQEKMKQIQEEKLGEKLFDPIEFLCVCSSVDCNGKIDTEDNGSKLITVNIFLLVSILVFM